MKEVSTVTNEQAGAGGTPGVAIPEHLQPFLREVIQDSLMRYDILRFFHENPYAILTISDLSVWVSREERPLAAALQQLAGLGYLSQSYASSAYTLTDDQEKRRRMDEFFGYMAAHPEVMRELRARLRRRVEVD